MQVWGFWVEIGPLAGGALIWCGGGGGAGATVVAFAVLRALLVVDQDLGCWGSMVAGIWGLPI